MRTCNPAKFRAAALVLLTSVSVVVFFRRERLDTRTWNTLVAPVLGALGLAGAIWLILANFPTLIGGSLTTAIWLACAVPVVMLLGVLASWRAGRTAQ